MLPEKESNASNLTLGIPEAKLSTTAGFVQTHENPHTRLTHRVDAHERGVTMEERNIHPLIFLAKLPESRVTSMAPLVMAGSTATPRITAGNEAKLQSAVPVSHLNEHTRSTGNTVTLKRSTCLNCRVKTNSGEGRVSMSSTSVGHDATEFCACGHIDITSHGMNCQAPGLGRERQHGPRAIHHCTLARRQR